MEKKNEKESKGGNDAELVSMMGMAALDNGGLDVIKKAMDSSQDPAQVIGQFLAQTILQMAEATQASLGIDPGVFLADDSFLDQMLDYIERQLGLPSNFSDQVYGEVLEVIKAVANSPDAEGGQQPQPAGPPQGGAPIGLDTGGM